MFAGIIQHTSNSTLIQPPDVLNICGCLHLLRRGLAESGQLFNVKPPTPADPETIISLPSNIASIYTLVSDTRQAWPTKSRITSELSAPEAERLACAQFDWIEAFCDVYSDPQVLISGDVALDDLV